MKQKQIIILALIFSALFLAVLVRTLIQNWRDQETGRPQVYGALPFELQPEAVEKILIGRGGKKPSVELVRVNGVWKVENLWGALAHTEKVDTLMQKLSGAKGELRGARKLLFKDFGIGEEQALFLKFAGSGKLHFLDLRVGTPSARREGCFLRMNGSDEVYFTDVPVAELLGLYTALEEAEPRADYWADLTLFRFRPERVISVEVKKEANPILGVHRESAGEDLSKNPWNFTKPSGPAKSPDPGKVLRFLAALDSVQAQTVADPAGKDYGLETPFLEITVTEKDAAAIKAVIGPKQSGEEACFVKVSGRSEIFKLQSHYLQDLEMTDEKLVKEAPAAATSPKAP